MPWVVQAVSAQPNIEVLAVSNRVRKDELRPASRVRSNRLPNVVRRVGAPILGRYGQWNHLADALCGHYIDHVLRGTPIAVAHVWSAYALEYARRDAAPVVLESGGFHVEDDHALLGHDGSPPGMRSAAWRARLCEEYERAAAIIVPSVAVRSGFIHRGAPPEKVHALQYGIDPAYFVGHQPNEFDFIFVGNLTYQKGYDLLLKALRMSPIPVSVAVVGGSPAGGKISDQGRTEVRSLGRLGRGALTSLYARSRYLVLPSRAEGYGMVATEAAASGCVPLVSDGAGVSETVVKADPALVFAAGSPTALSEALERATLRSESEWHDLSDRVSSLARGLTWAAYATSLTQVYSSSMSS